MKFENWKVGDRVRYVSGDHGVDDSNPLWSKYKIEGTVYKVTDEEWWEWKRDGVISFWVQWDNNETNVYLNHDLAPAMKDYLLEEDLFEI